MLIRKGIQNNRDPSTIYSAVADVERFFSSLGGGNYCNTRVSAEKLSPVAAAHRIHTNSIASLPWMVRQKVGEMRTEPAHDLEYVLKIRANEFMTPSMLKKVVASQSFWYGAAFCYIRRNSYGRVIELIPLPSEGYTRYKDTASGTTWYKFCVADGEPGSEKLQRKFAASELIIVFYESYDGVRGRGVMDLARDVIASDTLAMKYGERFYKNGTRVSGIVEFPGEIKNEETRRVIRDEFEHMASGMDNAFRAAVLDLGMKYTPLGTTQKDSQYIETRGFSVEEISRFTGIPGYMLQTGKQSYQSNEQQQLDFITNTMVPHYVQWEEEWAYKLFSSDDLRNGFYLKLNVASRLRGDDKTRSEYYEKMVGIGIQCQDECRAYEDKSPIPGGLGSHYWMSKNYDLISNIEKGGGNGA